MYQNTTFGNQSSPLLALALLTTSLYPTSAQAASLYRFEPPNDPNSFTLSQALGDRNADPTHFSCLCVLIDRYVDTLETYERLWSQLLGDYSRNWSIFFPANDRQLLALFMDRYNAFAAWEQAAGGWPLAAFEKAIDNVLGKESSILTAAYGDFQDYLKDIIMVDCEGSLTLNTSNELSLLSSSGNKSDNDSGNQPPLAPASEPSTFALFSMELALLAGFCRRRCFSDKRASSLPA